MTLTTPNDIRSLCAEWWRRLAELPHTDQAEILSDPTGARAKAFALEFATWEETHPAPPAGWQTGLWRN